MVEDGVVLDSGDDASVGVEPSDRPLDLLARPVATELSAVLGRLADAALAVRADQINATLGELLAERVAVAGLVVEQPQRDVAGESGVHERLGEVHLGAIGRLDLDRQREALAVNENNDLGPIAARREADAGPPPRFWGDTGAAANVPSAEPSSQSILPRRSSSAASLASACSSNPSALERPKRRQQVAYEGNDLGKSFQRSPVRRTQTIPVEARTRLDRRSTPFGPRLGRREQVTDQRALLVAELRVVRRLGLHARPRSTRGRSTIQGFISDTTTDPITNTLSWHTSVCNRPLHLQKIRYLLYYSNVI